VSLILVSLDVLDALLPSAQRWATTVDERLITTEYVLWEMVNSLSDPVDRPKAHATASEIRYSENWELIYATPKLLSDGLSLHRMRSDKQWSLTDCISFVTVEKHAISQALAHDHHFEQAGFQALLRGDRPSPRPAGMRRDVRR
jgi:uncharacterized protein